MSDIVRTELLREYIDKISRQAVRDRNHPTVNTTRFAHLTGVLDICQELERNLPAWENWSAEDA